MSIDRAGVAFFAVLDLFAHAFVFHLVERRQEVHHFLEGLVIDGVLGPQAFAAGIHDVRFDEDLHVVAQRGLGQGEVLQDVARRKFGAGKHIHDAEPGLIGERFEDGRKFFVARFVVHGSLLFSDPSNDYFHYII